MSNHSKELYALQDKDGNLIAIDPSSGGYPWVPETMQGVWVSTVSQEMLRYASGSLRKEGYRLVKVSFKVEVVPQEEDPCVHPYTNVIIGSGSGKPFCRTCGEYL